MALSLAVWGSGRLIYTGFGLTRNHVYPFPSLADAGFVGYALPAAVALLLFPRTSVEGVSRYRVVLDALVIASSRHRCC